MTVLSRGARVRRGGRRPGWLLLTALPVLAIAASSVLVFTDRVELLKLGVILALWAAVVAAFVSVLYRRQSDVDQARVRELKLVYDLQLDREISARREYELTVEAQLRRELASELNAQAADEVAALRVELATLRTSLEVLFGTQLDQRPALETERASTHGYSQWVNDSEKRPGDWVSRHRVTSVRAEASPDRAEENSIIDVSEEPVPPQPAADAAEAYRSAETYPLGAPGSNGAPADNVDVADTDTADDSGAPVTQPPPEEPTPGSQGGRYSGPAEPDSGTPGSMPVAQPAAPEPEPAARHRSAQESGDQGPRTAVQSVADLLARLQVKPSGGGRRRRRAAE